MARNLRCVACFSARKKSPFSATLSIFYKRLGCTSTEQNKTTRKTWKFGACDGTGITNAFATWPWLDDGGGVTRWWVSKALFSDRGQGASHSGQTSSVWHVGDVPASTGQLATPPVPKHFTNNFNVNVNEILLGYGSLIPAILTRVSFDLTFTAVWAMGVVFFILDNIQDDV